MSIIVQDKPPVSHTFSRERVAWLVLLGSFLVCVVLGVTIPYTIYRYLDGSTIERLASGQGTSGTTLIDKPDLPGDALVRINSGEGRADINEGSIIRTDATSQLLVEFFDGTTLTVYPNSIVTLTEMRQSRFEQYTSRADRVTVKVSVGRVRVQVVPTADHPRQFEVQTPQAPGPQGGIILESGSYAIESSTDITHVSVRSGNAVVKGQTGNAVPLTDDERAEINLGEAAVGPLPARRNLVSNPNFERLDASTPISAGPLADGWFVVSQQGGDGGTVDGTVEVQTQGVTRGLHFLRTNSGNNHGETAVVQQVGKLVGDYDMLTLRFDVQIVNQSLSGGGVQSSEFPMILRVDYKDQYGNPQYWTQGFYCQNPAGYNVINGENLPCNTRRSFELDLKRFLNNATTLDSIQFYASGWDWDVFVSDVELTVE